MGQFSKIKKQLLEQKQQLEERIEQYERYGLDDSLSFSTGELSQYDNHPADTATDVYERGKDLALFENLQKELEDVNDALNKWNNGTYGICEVTGQKIPYERLEVYPTARTVVEHASGRIPEHRPVEEEVFTNFNQFHFDGRDDETEFDAEDAYQRVAEFNENSMVFEDSSLDKTDELIGYVEEIEAFVSTDIHGYRGEDSVQFERNIQYDQYLNDK